MIFMVDQEHRQNHLTGIGQKVIMSSPLRVWRNWQTRKVQVLVGDKPVEVRLLSSAIPCSAMTCNVPQHTEECADFVFWLLVVLLVIYGKTACDCAAFCVASPTDVIETSCRSVDQPVARSKSSGLTFRSDQSSSC